MGCFWSSSHTYVYSFIWYSQIKDSEIATSYPCLSPEHQTSLTECPTGSQTHCVQTQVLFFFQTFSFSSIPCIDNFHDQFLLKFRVG